MAYKLPSILIDSTLFIDFPNMLMIIILHEYEKLTGAGKCFRNSRYFKQWLSCELYREFGNGFS